ncbi:hypothetical protein Aph01nite_65960 [Acrocarpospora phusangensis]|uniref:Integral membrane protein n=1 Tax=Acrocarpospora phusangensis TaxID=1070424 RepID=A0A919QG98_9ACTN|nr:hypothetical protein [Acrocarpospora phusangensis]GIH28286.1 hypothetical protein Aph01nite_65960 [Acrocarpospora phusangensis]
MADPSFPRDDLRATIAARRDLGPEYEAALTESFLNRIEATIAAQVAAEASRRLPNPKERAREDRAEGGRALGLALGSLGIAIPLTGAAAVGAGLPGIITAWTGIVLVNFAYALGRRRNR